MFLIHQKFEYSKKFKNRNNVLQVNILLEFIKLQTNTV